MTSTHTRLDHGGDESTPSGFGQGTELDIYTLQVLTRSATLDDALYSFAHPSSPDATPGTTHASVVSALEQVATTHPRYNEVAHNLAIAYAAEYGIQ